MQLHWALYPGKVPWWRTVIMFSVFENVVSTPLWPTRIFCRPSALVPFKATSFLTQNYHRLYIISSKDIGTKYRHRIIYPVG